MRITIKRVDPEEILREILGNIPYQIRKVGDIVEVTIERKHMNLLAVDRSTLRQRIKRRLPKGWKVLVED